MRAWNQQDTLVQVSFSIYLRKCYANVGYLTSPLLESESTRFGSIATFQSWSPILPKAVDHLAIAWNTYKTCRLWPVLTP